MSNRTVATSGTVYSSERDARLAIGCFKYAVGAAAVLNLGKL